MATIDWFPKNDITPVYLLTMAISAFVVDVDNEVDFDLAKSEFHRDAIKAAVDYGVPQGFEAAVMIRTAAQHILRQLAKHIERLPV